MAFHFIAFRLSTLPQRLLRRLKPDRFETYVEFIARTLGIGLYEVSDSERYITARFIALHKDECLFLLARVYEGAEYNVPRERRTWVPTCRVLVRMFSEEGWLALSTTGNRFRASDPIAAERAHMRARALVAATEGDPEDMMLLPEFAHAVQVCKDIGFLKNHPAPKEIDFAINGLYHLYFSHLLLSDELESFIAKYRSDEAMIRVFKNSLLRWDRALRR